MKRTISAVLLTVVAGSLGNNPDVPTAVAQTGVSGTWQAESIPPGTTWTAVLRIDDQKVSGT
jgi:nicotinamide mononucleotide (NMN) deamidase PncC